MNSLSAAENAFFAGFGLGLTVMAFLVIAMVG
jgi:hypothetical protein